MKTRGALTALALLLAALPGCGQTVRVTLRGEVMIAENRAALGTGVYSGLELMQRRLDGGRDLRHAGEAKVFVDVETAGQTLRFSIDKGKSSENFRFAFVGEGLGALRGIKLAVMVPGLGRTERYYQRPTGPAETLDLDFLAVVKERP